MSNMKKTNDCATETKIAAYTYDSVGNEKFISSHLKAVDGFIGDSFGEDAKYEVFVDRNGLYQNRDSFNSLMDNIRKGKYQCLVVPTLNRIYRPEYDMDIFKKLIQEIESYGVEIMDVSEGNRHASFLKPDFT